MKKLFGIPVPKFKIEKHQGVNVSATITLDNCVMSVLCMKDSDGNYYCKDTDFTSTIDSNILTLLTDLRGKKLTIRYLC